MVLSLRFQALYPYLLLSFLLLLGNHRVAAQGSLPLRFTHVAAAPTSSFALRSDGLLWAWGLGNNGQLGLGNANTPLAPVLVPTPASAAPNTTWARVATGMIHTLLLRTDGSLWACGANGVGQLGDGTTVSHASPAPVLTPATAAPGTTWTHIAAYARYSLAIRSDGTLWAWGGDTTGELGLGLSSGNIYATPMLIATPVGAAPGTRWIAVTAGAVHALALRSDGTLWAWGDNSFGQLGVGAGAIPRLSPVLVPSPASAAPGTTWTQVSAGSDHTLAIRSDGTLWAWGDNLRLQVTPLPISGRRFDTPQLLPTPAGATAGTTWVQVSANLTYSQALRSDGTLWSWGIDTYGQLGTNVASQLVPPTREYTRSTWAQVAAGGAHSLAIHTDGRVFATGNNGDGQLGLGNSRSFLTLYVPVIDLALTLPVTQPNALTKVAVYPNPARGYIFMTGLPRAAEVRLLDLQGREVFRQPAASTLALPPLPTGLYLLSLYTADGATSVTRLQIEQ